MKFNSQSNQYLMMRMKQKEIKKKPGLINQTRDSGYKTNITSWKANRLKTKSIKKINNK
jgi:hypothetical protein